MPHAPPNFYQRLGVPPTATAEDIRRAYRDLARKLHPDVNRSPTATTDFARVQEAYETLSDEQRRQVYDYTLRAAMTPGSDGRSHYTWTNIADPSSRVGAIDDELFEELYTAFFEPRFDDAPKPRSKKTASNGPRPDPTPKRSSPRAAKPKGGGKRGRI